MYIAQRRCMIRSNTDFKDCLCSQLIYRGPIIVSPILRDGPKSQSGLTFVNRELRILDKKSPLPGACFVWCIKKKWHDTLSCCKYSEWMCIYTQYKKISPTKLHRTKCRVLHVSYYTFMPHLSAQIPQILHAHTSASFIFSRWLDLNDIFLWIFF